MTGRVPGRYDFGEKESLTSGLMWQKANASLALQGQSCNTVNGDELKELCHEIQPNQVIAKCPLN